jgi:maltose/moltooligosaccharide transporter
MLTIQKRLSNSFFLLLGLPSTAMGFGLSIQIAVLSWILRTKYGLEIHEIGIVWAAGPIAGILGQPIIGLISDKVWFFGGRRRPFILIGGILTALSILALPNIDRIADFTGIANLMAVAITIALTLDLSINISFNPTRSIIADVTPDGDLRTKGYTWMQSISNLFGALAYLTSALIGNYELIYIGVAVILIFSILPTFFIEEPKVLSNQDNASTIGSQAKTNWPQLYRIFVAHGFSWLGIQTMFIYLFAFLEQKLTVSDPQVLGEITGWSFFILNGVGFLIPIFLLQPVSRKIGQVRTHRLAVASMSIGYFGIAFFTDSQSILYSFFFLLSLGWSAVVSLPFAIMSENVDKSRMGFFMGLFNLSVVIPQLIASMAIGFVINHYINTYAGIVFILSGISLAVSAFLWNFVKEPIQSIKPE